jgi:hypothetical protein
MTRPHKPPSSSVLAAGTMHLFQVQRICLLTAAYSCTTTRADPLLRQRSSDNSKRLPGSLTLATFS